MKIRKTSETKILNQHILNLFLKLLKSNLIEWKQTPFMLVGNGSIGSEHFDFLFKKNIYGIVDKQGAANKDWSYAFEVYSGKKEKEDKTTSSIRLRLKDNKKPLAVWTELENVHRFFELLKINLTDSVEDVFDKEALAKQIDEAEEVFNDKKTWYKKRLTKRKTSDSPPLELFVLLRMKNNKEFLFSPTVFMRKINSEISGRETLASDLLGEEDKGVSFKLALTKIKKLEEHLKENMGFLEDSSPLSIPKEANMYNYDFDLNMFKKDINQNFLEEDMDFSIDEVEDDDFNIDDYVNSSSRKLVKAQAENFEGYFTGDIPDYAANLVGSSSVDASQVESAFGRASEAINLVNQFDSSFLRNIAYIFNFAQGGAYGVYIPKLDEAIKTKALKNELESKGYRVEDEGGSFVAYHDDKEQDEVQREIDSIYQPLKSQGGHVISVNTSKILDDARQDAQNVFPLVEQVWTEQEVWENFAILHLGETIVHEATHAKGYDDEGRPTEEQKRFVNFALDKMNQKLQSDMNAKNLGDQFEPLPPMTSSRMAKNYSKIIKQASAYIPQDMLNQPVGSDISGRYRGINDRQNPAWGALDHLNSNEPIEKRLGRDFMVPLPSDLSQEHDHIDLQLRKYEEGTEENDPSHSLERLLTEFHDSEDSYELIEELLERGRPTPLLLPISKKEAISKRTIKTASLKKEATLFGWYNNLEISDGSTIPGLGDRVMAWDDRDESFTREEDWIRSQPRYNPRGYTEKGFWYKWVEPRFKPTLWEDTVTQNLGGIHPARRFASTDKDELTKIIAILAQAKKDIENKKIKGTRFIVSEDIFPYVEKLCNDKPSVFFEIDCFANKIPNHESVVSLWIVDEEVSEEEVQIAEDFMQGKNEEGYVCAENILRRNYEEDVHEIIDKGIQICRIHNLDVSVVGESARKLKQDDFNLECIDFGGTIEETLKFASLLSGKLGVPSISYKHNNQIACFFYKGVNLAFNIGFYPEVILTKKRMAHFSNIHKDLFNRDFKLNMVAYSLLTGELNNPLGVNVNSNILETLFDPSKVLNKNPHIMLRALTFSLEEGFVIGDKLAKEIRRRGQVYLQKCNKDTLEYYRERMKFCGINKMQQLLDSMNLDFKE